MTRDKILDELKNALSTLFDVDPETITVESRLGDDLDLDSIDAIDLIIKMQDLTGKKIDQESMKSIRTIGDIVDLVERILGA